MLISDIKIPFEPTDSNMQNKGMLIFVNLYQTWVRFLSFWTIAEQIFLLPLLLFPIHLGYVESRVFLWFLLSLFAL